MKKFIIGRILRALLSVMIVIAIVMVMIYTWLDRNLIFAQDDVYTKKSNNQQVVYKYTTWQKYGYLDYLPYNGYLNMLAREGKLDEETRKAALSIGYTPDKDSEIAKDYIAKFEAYCAENGYKIERLNAVVAGRRNKLATGGEPQLFAHRDRPLTQRLWSFFTDIVQIDNIHAVEDDSVGERKLSFTWYDPIYGGKKFAPALMGNGTTHKYLLYVDGKFPYVHQNLLTIRLGKSYTVNKDIDVVTTMTASQGNYLPSLITYPTGLVENSADDLHSATYMPPSDETSQISGARFNDGYSSVEIVRDNMSRMSFSFLIAILASILSYIIALPLGVFVALKKGKLLDKFATFYIVFITAVPGLCYILIFKAFGEKIGLPTVFKMEGGSRLQYVLPIISLMLPHVAGLLRWVRRYMIDQMNSDYVKFARSGGLSEREIFSKHIFKNAIIPIMHGIPGVVLGSMVGAFITESVYVVPGIGGLLIRAIQQYDNAVIVGVTLFFALISVTSSILGDVLMALVDPRINFTEKAR